MIEATLSFVHDRGLCGEWTAAALQRRAGTHPAERLDQPGGERSASGRWGGCGCTLTYGDPARWHGRTSVDIRARHC